MLKKYENGRISDIKRDGYLIVNGEKHLIINIQNQPKEILKANGIYEYIKTTPPEWKEGYWYELTYKLVDDVIREEYIEHEQENIEEVLEEGVLEE